jgi:hypothetical protein
MSLEPLYGGSETFESLLATMKTVGYRLVGLQPGFMNQETGKLFQVGGIPLKSVRSWVTISPKNADSIIPADLSQLLLFQSKSCNI